LKRFEKFAFEIDRLSLLGIGAYGFFLTTFELETNDFIAYLHNLKSLSWLLGLGVVAFAIAAALSLYSTHLSSECLGCQLDIVRMFNRLESNRWKPDEQEVNRGFVIDRQHAQKKFLDAIKESSGSAAIMLGAGAGVTAWAFAWAIVNVQYYSCAIYC
jgi:hypothetical protein